MVSSKHMVPDLWSSRGKSMTSKVGFIQYPVNMQEERSKRLNEVNDWTGGKI